MEALGLSISVPGVGPVKLDIAYGGMWYAVVESSAVGLVLRPGNGQAICRRGGVKISMTNFTHLLV